MSEDVGAALWREVEAMEARRAVGAVWREAVPREDGELVGLVWLPEGVDGVPDWLAQESELVELLFPGGRAGLFLPVSLLVAVIVVGATRRGLIQMDPTTRAARAREGHEHLLVQLREWMSGALAPSADALGPMIEHLCSDGR